MEYFYDLKKMLCKELEKVAEKKELTAGDLEVVDKLTHSIKSIVTILAMEEGGHSNENGYSGARKRDNMGRYADGGYYGRYYDGGYSGRRYYDDGMSNIIYQIERLMNETSAPEEREVLQSTINRLKNMWNIKRVLVFSGTLFFIFKGV